MSKGRLLSLNTYHYKRGGSDAIYLEHELLFKKAGWEAAHIAMTHPRNEISPWSEFFVDELEFGNEYTLLDKAGMTLKVIYSWEAKSKVKRLIDEFKPDIAHAHCIYHHLSPSVLSPLKSAGIPTVMTAHDLKLACPAYKMLNKTGICERCKGGNLLNVIRYRCLHDSLVVSSLVAAESAVHKALGLYRRYLDAIVVPSRFFQDKLAEWGWSRDKLHYVPNFIRSEDYLPVHTPGDYFLYFGRLAPEKGVDTMIAAAAQAGVPLRIAGTGPWETHLRSLASASDGEVVFLGYQAGDQLWDTVAGARAVVLPSEWYENAPVSVLEAYAMGKPVIAARIGGIPEMVVESQTGFLFDSGNVEDLSRILTSVATTANTELAEMGRQARRYVETEFTVDRYMDGILRLYRLLGVKTALR